MTDAYAASAPPADHSPQVPPDRPLQVDERRRRWADLVRRVYEVDPLTCRRWGAPMRILAFILDAKATDDPGKTAGARLKQPERT